MNAAVTRRNAGSSARGLWRGPPCDARAAHCAKWFRPGGSARASSGDPRGYATRPVRPSRLGPQ